MQISKRDNGTLSSGEVGSLLGVNRRTVGFWATSGKLKVSRTGGNAIRVHIKDVIAAALDGDIAIARNCIPYDDAELLGFGVPKSQVLALSK